jgi:hypothetical protein
MLAAQQKKKPITDKLVWRANYSDGTEFWQYDLKTRQENLFKDIDMDKIVSFDLLKPIEDIEEVTMGATDIRCKSELHPDLQAVMTLKVYHKGQQPFLHVDLPKPKRLIYVRKKRITTGRDIATVTIAGKKDKDGKETGGKVVQVPFPPLESLDKTMIVCGWQETVNGKNVQALCYIYPNGMIELGGEFKDDAIHTKVAPYEEGEVNTLKVEKVK